MKENYCPRWESYNKKRKQSVSLFPFLYSHSLSSSCHLCHSLSATSSHLPSSVSRSLSPAPFFPSLPAPV